MYMCTALLSHIEVGTCVVQGLTERCDQLRDEVLRGLELSEKARCVHPVCSYHTVTNPPLSSV